MGLASEPGLVDVVARIAHVVQQDTFPAGDRAALRRMVPEAPPPLALYRIVYRYHLPEFWNLEEETFRDWLTVLAGIALMAPRAHTREWGLGRALAETGYSEHRLERLLASEGPPLRVFLLRAARFLAAHGMPFNWVEGAALLLMRDAARQDQLRRRVAAEYYRHRASYDAGVMRRDGPR